MASKRTRNTKELLCICGHPEAIDPVLRTAACSECRVRVMLLPNGQLTRHVPPHEVFDLKQQVWDGERYIDASVD